MPPEIHETASNAPSAGTLALLLGVLLALFIVAVFALRTWYRNTTGIQSSKDMLPTPEQRDLVSLVHVARYVDETSAALERERASRLSAEDALTRSRSLLERTLAERLRLGRELHDDTCQVLYGVTLHLDALRTLVEARAPDLEPGVARSLDQLRSLNKRVRSYVDKLETSPMPTATWGGLLAEAAAPFSGLPGLSLPREVTPLLMHQTLSAEFAEDLVACVREAHANALRHGAATEIRSILESTPDGTKLTLRDNGVGFDTSVDSKGHGLANLRARAERMGGTLSLTSTPGSGTQLTFLWPASKPSP